MSDLAIRVENLSKKYHIGRKRKGYQTLRDTISATFVAPFRRAGKLLSGQATGAAELDETIWALKDVSFEVKHGEIIGIIGRNGAGKSTLLKILSRITEPTKGCAEMYGRVGSLLEVGTGFHPELTGRENAYLNGAILGMRRAEIDRKFDEIVAFAEVEKFIDTPVKHYSSGMGVRLAFSIAAHLEPEILVIDEVLAVGDVAFQRKCLGKMDEVAHQGRTVLFVSHTMPMIESFCERVILLDAGNLIMDAPAPETINYYLSRVLPAIMGKALSERTDRRGSGQARLTHFYMEDTDGNQISATATGKDTIFVLGYESADGAMIQNVDVGISVLKRNEDQLFVLYSSYVNQIFDAVPPAGEFRCLVPDIPLTQGQYVLGGVINVNGIAADWFYHGLGFIEVEGGDFYGTGHPGFSHAPIQVRGSWAISNIKSSKEVASADTST